MSALALALGLLATELHLGAWDAHLASPGGELSFGLELERAGGELRGHLVNGEERIELGAIALEGERLSIDLAPYDARLEARVGTDGRRMEGSWTKRRTGGRTATLPFAADARGEEPVAADAHAASPAASPLGGRWAVDFSSDEHPAVGIFSTAPGGELRGTFLTALGDYRYLAGRARGDELVLSCFDGAHAFLFRARRLADGSLSGDFWSADSWHETWTAVRDDAAAPPDAFALSRWTGADLAGLRYPDLDGVERSLEDPGFRGPARVLQVFGSWCPNCNDEARLLAELDRRYRERGLRVLGLAFELTGEHAQDAAQVRRFAQRHGVEYPILIAGTADKAAASAAFPALDRVVAFPTTIFLDGRGRALAVHTGFAGPATGAAHAKLRERFEALIEECLDSPFPATPTREE